MEELTQQELRLLAVSLNAKIRELEFGLKSLGLDESPIKTSYEDELKRTKNLQEKLYRMYKF